MYVFFRLFIQLIRALFSKKMGPLDTSTISLRVLPNDIDYNFHLNNGRYLTLMDIGRFDLILRTPMLDLCLKRRWLPIVGSVKIKYSRPLPLFGKYQLKTKVVAWDQKWVYLRQEFHYKSRPYAEAYVQALFQEKGKNVPFDRIVEILGIEYESPTDPKTLGLERTKAS